MEERQSRIAQEQKDGGTGTAYALAVSHMLKKDTPKQAAAACSSSSRKRGNSTADSATATSKDDAPHSLSSSPSTTTSSSLMKQLMDNAIPTPTSPKNAVVVAHEENDQGADEHDRKKVGGEIQAAEEQSAGQLHQAAHTTANGCVGSDTGSYCDEEDGEDSESYDGSEGDSDEGDGEGLKRRGWAERRARLRKDGMHGRRLPPPSAEEERASAKADKKEVKIV